MSAQTERPKAVLIMGPTASGKSRLAIELAQSLGGEVISVDSALVFRGMDIGTAKPDLSEREGIPHHLIDILDPSESYSTGQFQKDAEKCILEITQRGKVPILAGGTMLYFHGLLHGISALPPADPDIRAALDSEARHHGWGVLHERLKAIDPVAADRIHPNDPQRIQRALEIHQLTGRSMTDVIAENPPPPKDFDVIPVLVAPKDRARLAERISQRFEAMLKKGLIEEVQALKDRGDLHLDLPSMRAVGYRQVWEHLEGNASFEEMRTKGITATRQFAKRQMTWLRKESFPLELESEDPRLLEKARQAVGSLLA
ncbi:MAG TPA: tRNA (adenosine(37)-N6)-dimethylallyltransferase MiaA [Methylococcaceae bacterium]|nr:tRNA (adenosine(37)-N6)-dimethylallyltransferase MiaA [Methylococcaceae bacterium]